MSSAPYVDYAAAAVGMWSLVLVTLPGFTPRYYVGSLKLMELP